MNDESIIELYRTRNEEAVKLTGEKYGGLIFAAANGILRDKADSDECVNDVLLKAWSSLPADIVSLPAYLTKLARNAALDRLRRRTAEKRSVGETALIFDELEECIPAPLGGEQLADGHALRELLGRFLEKLPRAERAVFMDRYYFALTAKEIAFKRGIPEGRIAMRLLRTRKKLKAFLEKEGVGV